MSVYVAPVARELVGVAEIADKLGVTRQRVHQLSELPDFPQPVVTLSAGRIYDWAEVKAWARATGRMQ